MWRNLEFWQNVPFIGLMVQSYTGKVMNTPVVVRLIESGIIGLVVMYGTSVRLEERIEGYAKIQAQAQAITERRLDRLESFYFKSSQ